MVKVNWTRQAIENLHEIREYYTLHSKQFAEQLTDKIFEKTTNLEQFPQMGRMVPEIGRPAIRELFYTKYRIIYHLITPTQINILAIHSGLHPLTENSLFE